MVIITFIVKKTVIFIKRYLLKIIFFKNIESTKKISWIKKLTKFLNNISYLLKKCMTARVGIKLKIDKTQKVTQAQKKIFLKIKFIF